jgi:hypothetical protein
MNPRSGWPRVNRRKPIEGGLHGSILVRTHGAVGAQVGNEFDGVALEAEGDIGVEGGMRQELSAVAGEAHGLEGMGVPPFVESKGDGG